MKKLKTAFLIILSISIFLACSRNNDEAMINPNEQTSIVNKWNLGKWVYNNTNHTLTQCDKSDYIQFNSDGTFKRIGFYLASATMCLINENDKGTYTFNTTTKKITANFTDPVDGAQVENLNNIQLTTTTFKYSYDEDGNGTDEHTLEYKK